MKSFFANKMNILLTFLLVTMLAALGFCGYKLISNNKKVYVPDFSLKSEEEINTWCNSLETNPCTITSEYSDTVEKGKLIYQSIKAEEELTDKISFIISLGKKIELPTIDENTTKQTIDDWLSTNGFKNILYIEEYSDTVVTGNVIKVECADLNDINSEVKVFISKGKNVTPDDTIYVEYGTYFGLTQSQFEEAVSKIGLKATHDSSKDAYSSTIDKDSVVWHGSTDYVKDEEIRYGLSLGVDPNAIKVEYGTYVGETFEDFKKAVSELGSKGLVPKHKEEKDAYSDTIAKGSIVWHGSGTYEEQEEISYGLSLGKEGSATTDTETYVDYGTYIGKTEAEMLADIATLTVNGLTPNHGHSNHKDEYSDTYAKGTVIWHGSGSYVDKEQFNYTLSLGKKDSSSSDEIVVTSGTYVGKTYDEFKALVSKLGSTGLIPKHRDYRDAYSDTIAKGSIIWHGSGTYEDGEEISYGLSLGKKDSDEIVVTSGTYVGKTFDEFKSLVSKLGTSGLTPKHKESRDSYSDTIAKGSIVWHGSGTYENGEEISYGLSLGPNTVKVNVVSYAGKSESEFKTYLSNNGLTAGTRTEQSSDTVASGYIISNDTGSKSQGSSINYVVSIGKNTVNVVSKAGTSEADFISYLTGLGLSKGTRSEEYSSSVAEGKIISNKTGLFNVGSKVDYVVSKGTQKASIMRPAYYTTGSSYDATKANMEKVLSVFTNVVYTAVEVPDYTPGQIYKIEVNVNGTMKSDYSAGEYPVNTKIIVYICSKTTH